MTDSSSNNYYKLIYFIIKHMKNKPDNIYIYSIHHELIISFILGNNG